MSTGSEQNNNVLEQCLDVVKVNNDEMSSSEMRNALAAIAMEVQRYCCANSTDEPPQDIEAFKVKLNTKKKQIKALKDNLNTAYTIAKHLLSAKETEFQSLNNHLVVARNESVNLLMKSTETEDVIKRLTMENHLLSQKLESLNTFIELGYNEVQKMRDCQAADLPIIMQLKEILVCCGQYYADYCNEHETCIQLEQKNRFLTNKLRILESNLESSTEQLKKLQRGQKGKMVEKKCKTDARKIGYASSEYKFGTDVNVSRVTLNSIETTRDKSMSKDETLDLSMHMTLVKNLIKDQDTMLKDLKTLTNELGDTYS